MKEFFGISAGLLGVAAAIPYISSILNHKTVPHRISWLIWLLLGIVILISQLDKGARWSILLICAGLVNNTIIFFISLKYGTGGTSMRDRTALVIALIGIVLWAVTKEAYYGLFFAIFADAIGTFLTAEKAYKKPGSENPVAWTLATAASICGLLAVHTYTIGQTIHPLYAVLGGGSIAIIAWLRRGNRIKRPQDIEPAQII